MQTGGNMHHGSHDLGGDTRFAGTMQGERAVFLTGELVERGLVPDSALAAFTDKVPGTLPDRQEAAQ